MARLIPVSEKDVMETIKKGEFPDSILNAKPNVGIVMTQDWCPQWTYMRNWIFNLEEREDLALFSIIYNQESYFEEFMDFKETHWMNDIVPYVRYYSNGKFICATNAVSEGNFFGNFCK